MPHPPKLGLYDRLGFRKVGRNGGSDTLLLALPGDSSAG